MTFLLQCNAEDFNRWAQSKPDDSSEALHQKSDRSAYYNTAVTHFFLTFLGKTWSPTTISFSTVTRAFPGTTGYSLLTTEQREENVLMQASDITRQNLPDRSVSLMTAFRYGICAMWSLFGTVAPGQMFMTSWCNFSWISGFFARRYRHHEMVLEVCKWMEHSLLTSWFCHVMFCKLCAASVNVNSCAHSLCPLLPAGVQWCCPGSPWLSSDHWSAGGWGKLPPRPGAGAPSAGSPPFFSAPALQLWDMRDQFILLISDMRRQPHDCPIDGRRGTLWVPTLTWNKGSGTCELDFAPRASQQSEETLKLVDNAKWKKHNAWALVTFSDKDQ